MRSQTDGAIRSPWHEGEVRLQEEYGVAERMDVIGRKVIRPFMPLQHREFFSQLPYLVAGSVDAQGDIWVGLIAGLPGFVSSPTDRRLDVAAGINAQDPVSRGLKNGEALGILGIQPETRRRNRMNGTVNSLNGNGFSISVQQSFGNCPRYIQHRDYEFTRNPQEHASIPPQPLSANDPRVAETVSKADTFFVSSYVDTGGGRQVDVSHRGGKSGFVKVALDGTLTVPDYAGNLFFSTLGNFLKNPKAGLIFPDFETGDVLQMTGDAEVILSSPEIDSFESAERIWMFRPRKVVFRPAALPLKWAFREFSPHLRETGTWEDTTIRSITSKNETISFEKRVF